MKADDIIKYWEERSKKQGERTVGYGGDTLQSQDTDYEEVFSFVMPNIDCSLPTLDYGCGIGRYTKFFDSKNYLGVDITKSLLDIARDRNPDYYYKLLSAPYMHDLSLGFQPKNIITATVLQHNPDEVVSSIIDWFKMMSPEHIYLYENTANKSNSNHMCFRSIQEYKSIVDWDMAYAHSHIVRNEQHTLMRFDK